MIQLSCNILQFSIWILCVCVCVCMRVTASNLYRCGEEFNQWMSKRPNRALLLQIPPDVTRDLLNVWWDTDPLHHQLLSNILSFGDSDRCSQIVRLQVIFELVRTLCCLSTLVQVALTDTGAWNTNSSSTALPPTELYLQWVFVLVQYGRVLMDSFERVYIDVRNGKRVRKVQTRYSFTLIVKQLVGECVKASRHRILQTLQELHQPSTIISDITRYDDRTDAEVLFDLLNANFQVILDRIKKAN